jgi:putative flippase GtrA
MEFLGQFGRFALVGGIATVIQYGILYGLVNWAARDPVWASAIGYCLSAIANYMMNYLFTFGSKASHGSAAIKFAVIATLGLALNSLVMTLMVNAAFYYFIAQFGATVVVLIWNFAGGRYWTFRD